MFHLHCVVMKMADRAGFEPAETLLPHTLSKRAHSTTLPPVLREALFLYLFCGGARKFHEDAISTNVSDSTRVILARDKLSCAPFWHKWG